LGSFCQKWVVRSSYVPSLFIEKIGSWQSFVACRGAVTVSARSRPRNPPRSLPRPRREAADGDTQIRKVFGFERRARTLACSSARDLVILCRTGKAEEALRRLRELMGKLKLTVNEEKTRICKVP